jgi:hypothetical protein
MGETILRLELVPGGAIVGALADACRVAQTLHVIVEIEINEVSIYVNGYVAPVRVYEGLLDAQRSGAKHVNVNGDACGPRGL